MYTNIFRLGGLQTVSWFQLQPEKKDESSGGARISEEHGHIGGRGRGGAKQVLEAHLQLQNDGQLSAWTFSPEPEANVKLWIFILGRQENGSPPDQPAFSGLSVVGTGIWRSPGIRDEVSFALCQALRNRFERALNLLGYARFGDIFVKCKQIGLTEMASRRSLPSFEMEFVSSDEAIFVHFVICRRRLRPLTSSDMHATLAQQLEEDSSLEKRISVLLSPFGMIGKLTGFCPGDLVRQLYQSKVDSSDDLLTAKNMLLLPSTSGNPAAVFRTWYAEVRVRYFVPGNSKSFRGSLLSPDAKLVRQLDSLESKRGGTKEENSSILKGCEEVEVSFIFPPEAVLVPISPPIPSQTFRRRCWLQNWAGTGWLEDASFGNDCRRTQQPCDRSGPFFSATDSVGWVNGFFQPKSGSSYSSASTSSGSSSIKSSSSHGTSGTDSEVEGGADSDEGLKADAESLGLAGEKSDTKTQNKGANTSLKRERTQPFTQTDELPVKAARKANTFGEVSGFLEGGSVNTSKIVCNQDEVNGLLGMAPTVGTGTPKGTANQTGISWDWNEDDKGIGIDMQNDADIFAEFGDFGDFFEDDALGFGEPPGTAESQALMFSLADCGEGTNTPGTVSIDTSDPLLMPILDFPGLESFEPQMLPKELNFQEHDDKILKETSSSSPQDTPRSSSTLTKVEAMFLFSPEYAAVDIHLEKSYDTSPKQAPYVPRDWKLFRNSTEPDSYVYNAIPPPIEVGAWKPGQGGKVKSEEQGVGSMKATGSNHHIRDQNDPIFQPSTSEKNVVENNLLEVNIEGATGHDLGLRQPLVAPSIVSRDEKAASSRKVVKKSKEGFSSSVSVVASELECTLFHIRVRSTKGAKPFWELRNHSTARSWKVTANRLERGSDFSSKQSSASVRQYEQRKKDHIPVRIAGDADEPSHDGPRTAEIGVWRPVGAPKSQKAGSNFENDLACFSSSSVSIRNMKQPSGDGFTRSNLKVNQWEEALATIPLLVQQAIISNDVSLNGDPKDGPLGWLERHLNSNMPSFSKFNDEMIGSLDAAGTHPDRGTLGSVDPLVAEVSPSTVASLLQSDVQQAMSAAFGDMKLAGPLKLSDWCRGKVTISDALQVDNSSAGCGYSDSKDLASSITVAVGEPITPPQCTAGGLSGSKGYSSMDMDNQAGDFRRNRTNRALDTSTLSDQLTDSQRRATQDLSSADSDTQTSVSSLFCPIFTILPIPALLVGYQDDWLKVSSSSLRLWEKAPFEPYALPKPVTYYVISLNSEPLLSAASDFFQQLSTVYEACRLGTHTPANITTPISSRHTMQGLLTVDISGNQNQASSTLSSFSLASAHVVNMDCSWNLDSFRRSLRRVCRSLQCPDRSASVQRDPEQSPSIVVYLVSPSADPSILLKILLDACEALGLLAGYSDDYHATRNNLSKGISDPASFDEYIHSVPTLFGFSNSRLALQLISPDIIFKQSNDMASGCDLLKEVAFGVYNKIRRLPLKFGSPEVVSNVSSLKRRPVTTAGGHSTWAMSGLWKDCTSVLPIGGSSSLARDNVHEGVSPRTGSWDNARQSSRLPEMGADSALVGCDKYASLSCTRFLYEPLYILADPGSLENGVGNLFPNIRMKDKSGGALEEAGGNALRSSVISSADSAPISFEAQDTDASDSSQRQASSFHCCYAWTHDWQWLLSVWTDSRGEFVDVHIYPLPGISESQDGKKLYSLFMQMLEQGLQLLSATAEAGNGRPRSIIFARVGEIYESECQEWNRVFTTLGGDDIRNWAVQICSSPSDQMVSTPSASMQQREPTIVERSLGLAGTGPASPSTSLIGSRNISSTFTKHASSTKVQINGSSMMQFVQSISLVTIQIDHSLQILWNADTTSPPASQFGNSSFLNLPKPPPTANGAYVIVPAHGLLHLSTSHRYFSQNIASDLPYVAKLLSSKGLCNPIISGWAVSGAITSARMEMFSNHADQGWPSALHVALVTQFSRQSYVSSQDPSLHLGGGNGLCEPSMKSKWRKSAVENKEQFGEAQHALGCLIAELHALSWLNAGPNFPRRISPLPFHCTVALRLKKLIGFMDEEIGLSSLQL